MKRPKAILFDMGDTLILQYGSNFLKGTKKLMTFSDNPKKISASIVQERATALTKEYSCIQEKHSYDYTCASFQKYLFESFDLKLKINAKEQEIIFNRTAFERKLAPGTIEFLEYLKKENIRVGILSNTTFSENTLRDELSIYHLQDAFEFVIATSEYMIRKPDKRIFDVALQKFQLGKEDVWYVGNSFKYDVMGATNAGLYPVWYNHANALPLAEVNYFEIKSFQTLIELLGK